MNDKSVLLSLTEIRLFAVSGLKHAANRLDERSVHYNAANMTEPKELRGGSDRRRQPRGGRRPTDVDGLAPLVMVVGDDQVAVGLAEAVLAKLRFAVTTSRSVDDATRIMPGLKPDIIVAAAKDASRLRSEAPQHMSVVEMSDAMRGDPLVLVESIRQTIRANMTSA